MIVVGLTGSIGMGKSTTAKLFADEGIPVFDADAEAHILMAKNGAAVAPVEAAFPGVAEDGEINRLSLGQRVLGDKEALLKLEAILHPLIGEQRERFLVAGVAQNIPLVVLDIPLLFEKKQHQKFDAIVVASADGDVQRQRVLARKGMTPDKLDAILSHQLPDAEKRARADYIVETDKGLDHARQQVRAIINDLKKRNIAHA